MQPNDPTHNALTTAQNDIALQARDTFNNRVAEQNARLIQEEWARREQIATRNRLAREEAVNLSPRSANVPGFLPNVSQTSVSAETTLCMALEQKVTQPGYDIAEINLLAAKGLPGVENLDIEKSLKTLNQWADWVRHETDRHLYRFQKTPGEYNNSEGYFRMLLLVCTIQQDFKVCYNKDPKMRAGPVEVTPTDVSFFNNPRDLFIHGLTEGEHQGTCASLPVLYVAIGRRLGYPLKLVECKGHLFVRWEDAKERFNIEGTSRGVNCYPDQEYMEWPWPISKEELATGMYMTPLSPRRELAAFLELRSLCLKANKRDQDHMTVKVYADNLRKKEGVDLDRLNALTRQSVGGQQNSSTVASALLYQTLTNTNSWRERGNERGAPSKRTVFAVDRPDIH